MRKEGLKERKQNLFRAMPLNFGNNRYYCGSIQRPQMTRLFMAAWMAALWMAAPVMAQDDDNDEATQTNQTWAWGLKAGPSWSMLWGGLEYDTDMLERYNATYIESVGKMSFTAGGMIFAQIDPRFSFRIEALFNLRGGTFKHQFNYKDNGKFGKAEPYFIEYYEKPGDRNPVRRDTLPTVDSTFRYGKSWNYTFGHFQIPLLAQINLSQTGAKPYAIVGFAPSLALISKVRNEYLAPLENTEAERLARTVVEEDKIPVPELRDAEIERNDVSFAFLDLAMIVGAGIRIPVRNNGLHFEGRYDLGFLYQHRKVRNQAFSFHVGWEFGGKGGVRERALKPEREPKPERQPKPEKRKAISE